MTFEQYWKELNDKKGGIDKNVVMTPQQFRNMLKQTWLISSNKAKKNHVAEVKKEWNKGYKFGYEKGKASKSKFDNMFGDLGL